MIILKNFLWILRDETLAKEFSSIDPEVHQYVGERSFFWRHGANELYHGLGVPAAYEYQEDEL